MTLYSEVELLLEYLKEEDWFYYLLVYDPQQKTLLADRGEIGVGDEYQSEIEVMLTTKGKDVLLYNKRSNYYNHGHITRQFLICLLLPLN